MTLLTVQDITNRGIGQGSDDPDVVIQDALDMAEAKIVAWGGENFSPNLELTHREYITVSRRGVYPRRFVGALISVTVDQTPVDLNMVYVDQQGRRIGRTGSETWCGNVEVRYSPVDDTAIRKRLQLSLVSLYMLNVPGLVSLDYGGELGDGQFRVFATEETRLLKSTLPVLRPE